MENMIEDLKITPDNEAVPVPASDPAVMATMATINKSVFISGSPTIHTTQTTASLRLLSAWLGV